MIISRRLVTVSIFAALIVAQPLGATNGAMDEDLCGRIQTLLQAGNVTEDVLSMALENSEMTLAEATVYTMNCGGEGYAIAVATAGIAMAGNLAQAQTVADAVLAQTDPASSLSGAVDAALNYYIDYMPQPDVYDDQYTPTGPGVSPSV